ncbi:MAG TPA: beta-ketoacyl-ACP synthase II [Thermodesulfobacteriota bacterium]|nr:beta-ketoacyl-ACP synthase II [Thermodesulfobacteriota bacterium]
MERRVVVTGLGIISPLGIGIKENWQALCEGRSGIGPITRFDTTEYETKIAGEVKNFDPTSFLDRKEARKMDPFIHYALASGIMAMEDSHLKIDQSNAERVGVLVGAGLGGLTTIEKYHSILLKEGPKKISPFFIPMLIVNLAPGQISIFFGAKGPNSSVVTACATGNHSIGEAYKIIQRGDADAMIAGGAESTITPLAIGGFNAMKALSTRNEEPQKASRPFEKDRDGFVIAEGAGILILEELSHAVKRNATIHAEIIGYGCNADAYHIAAPSPNGEGAARCMEIALHDAGIPCSEVDYINAHGTSTPLNDLAETIAMKTVFKEHTKKLMVSSTKSMTGHLLGASGGVEAVFTILTMKEGIVPPTINYEVPDPECDLDYVPNVARKAKVRVAMSNSFGFGGTNAALVFKEFTS